MKNLLFLFLLVVLVSCSSAPSIPEGSIYQAGDVVYKIDRVEDVNDTTAKPLACDAEFIYRPDRKELIYVEFNNIKWYDFITHIEYGMVYANELDCDIYHSQVKENSYLIADNYVVILHGTNVLKMHILQTLKY